MRRGDRGVVEWFCIFLYEDNLFVGTDPDDVEGDQGVMHPEAVDFVLIKDEQHAVMVCQGFSEHEALAPFFGGFGYFDGKFVFVDEEMVSFWLTIGNS